MLNEIIIYNQIDAYEEGQLNSMEIIYMFANMVRTGLVWELQGSYGRAAFHLIQDGYITEDGQVNLDLCEAEIMI